MKLLMIGQTIICLGGLLILNYDLALIYRAITDINTNLYTMYKAIKKEESESDNSEVINEEQKENRK